MKIQGINVTAWLVEWYEFTAQAHASLFAKEGLEWACTCGPCVVARNVGWVPAAHIVDEELLAGTSIYEAAALTEARATHIGSSRSVRLYFGARRFDVMPGASATTIVELWHRVGFKNWESPPCHGAPHSPAWMVDGMCWACRWIEHGSPTHRPIADPHM